MDCTEPGNDLVDRRFLGALPDRERPTLERHLSACHACTERYRRLQLTERVAAHGAEGALERPSPLEVERIAKDLGLLEPPRVRRFSWAFRLIPALAVDAGLALAFWLPPREVLTPRGEDAATLAFTVYEIAPDGQTERLDGRVGTDRHLKLRGSWSDGAARPMGAVLVAIVPRDGEPRLFDLAAPEGTEPVRTVPGSIALADLPPGPAMLYVITGATRAAVLERVRAKAAEIPGARSVARFEVEIEAP